jgi:hypothetical protein
MSVIYRITKMGDARRAGINRPFEARVGGFAKSNDESPYTIANEVVSARIGQVLGLPVPAGVLSQDGEKKFHYLSLNVGQEGRELPPVIPPDFCAEEPLLAAGVVVFDVLIANGDRHRKNLSRDTTFDNEPARVSVYDHGHALFGTDPPTGPDRLELANDRLGCTDDEACIARDSCLIDQPLDCRLIDQWVQRAKEIPAFVFADICREIGETPGLNVNPFQADDLANWLAGRASGLSNLIWQNREAFPAVNWGLWPPGGAP